MALAHIQRRAPRRRRAEHSAIEIGMWRRSVSLDLYDSAQGLASAIAHVSARQGDSFFLQRCGEFSELERFYFVHLPPFLGMMKLTSVTYTLTLRVPPRSTLMSAEKSSGQACAEHLVRLGRFRAATYHAVLLSSSAQLAHTRWLSCSLRELPSAIVRGCPDDGHISPWDPD